MLFVNFRAKQHLKNFLNGFLDSRNTVIISSCGLCTNLRIYIDKHYGVGLNDNSHPVTIRALSIFNDLSKEWPMYSNHSSFPIFDKLAVSWDLGYPVTVQPLPQFFEYPKYSGRQLELRTSLAKFVLSKLG